MALAITKPPMLCPIKTIGLFLQSSRLLLKATRSVLDMLSMNWLTLSGPCHADSYVYRRIRAFGQVLRMPSGLVIQFQSVLVDFQLSFGCAPNPGTKTTLTMLDDILRIGAAAILDVRFDVLILARVNHLEALLYDFIAFSPTARTSRRLSSACTSQRHTNTLSSSFTGELLHPMREYTTFYDRLDHGLNIKSTVADKIMRKLFVPVQMIPVVC